MKRYVHGDDGKMKHKEREQEEDKEEEKRIDAPLFIFSLVLFLLFFFAILFGSFVKFPSFNSSVNHHYDVHSHALNHIHHKSSGSNEGED